MRKPRILIPGYTNMELTCFASDIPNSDETLISFGTYSISPGGKGALSAIAAARLGAEMIFCTKLGNDTFGKQLFDTLKNENIDCRFVFFDPEQKTGFSQIFTQPDGRSRTVIFPGANKKLSLENVEEAFTSYPDALLVQCEAEPSLIKFSAVQANRQQIPVFLDLSPEKEGLESVFKAEYEIVFATEEQMEFHTGIFPGSADSYLLAAIALFRMIKTKYVVINLQNRGCYIYDGIHQELIQPLDVRAAYPSGANEAFVGALVTRYMQNRSDISDAARFANCVRAYSVTNSGASESFPDLAQLEDFINNYIER